MLLLFRSLQTPAEVLTFKVTIQPGGLTDYVTVVVRDIGLEPPTGEQQLREWLGSAAGRIWVGDNARPAITGRVYLGRMANTWGATWPANW